MVITCRTFICAGHGARRWAMCTKFYLDCKLQGKEQPEKLKPRLVVVIKMYLRAIGFLPVEQLTKFSRLTLHKLMSYLNL
jgi:hypothetical protein